MGKVMREFYAERRRAQRAADPDREKRRYSANKHDDQGGYYNWMMGGHENPGKTCRVYCDGKHVSCPVMADELKGRVVYHPQPLRIVDGEIVSKTLRGAVLVEWE
jgi:hypothetical protein